MGHNNRSTTKRAERTESLGRTALWVLLSGVAYYLATQIAWALCFPNSKVSLFFPPHAVLVSDPAARPHPALVGLHARRHRRSSSGHAAGTLAILVLITVRGFRCGAELAVAAGIRIFIKSPLKLITLRERSSLF